MNRRRGLALGILVVWVTVLAVHVRREYFKPELAVLAEGARALAPGTHFYAVRMDSQSIGLASSRLDTVPEGFVIEDRVTLDVPALDTIHRAETLTWVELGPALEIRGFHFDLESEVGRFRVRGRARSDSVLVLEMGAGDEAQRSEIRLGPDLVLAGALPLRLAAGGRLAVGRAFEGELFDPSVMARRSVALRVVAHDTLLVPDSAVLDRERQRWVPARYDTVPSWRIDQSFNGITVASWVDEDGRVVRAESPLGFTMERTASELALDEWERARDALRMSAAGSGYGPIIENTAIASNVDLDAVGAVERLRVRLRSVELDGFDLSGGRQTLRGDTLIVRRESLDGLEPGYRLPYRGGGEAAEALASTPLIQASHPAIRRIARRAARDSDDPVEVARRLNDWVYGSLKKDVTLSVPSALQVLKAGQGDCNEHTVAYVALARAVGLPARTAVGLVHVNGRFYYHAWPEVWLGRWVAVDPTLGQFPADASHLRFIIGGLARQVELVRLIGRLQLDVL